ncbi:MAG: glucose-1-phosphate adenylyltransferase subunit GlgD [Erysipelotrichaceae bacterium]|nr:glucose-1-phosphate adenylyltransferase subunit GlgD [Erysipelotrichaceae bacterium]
MKALGIVNIHKDSIEGLGDYRPLAATSFLGRYRLVDFVLSNMANSGIDVIQVYIKEKPRSIVEHIGSGRHYNINSKRGRIMLLGDERRLPSEAYNTDINSFDEHMQFIDRVNVPYVIIAPCNYIYMLNYDEVLAAHIESEADVTMVYKSVDTAKEKFLGCDTINLNTKKTVVSMEPNRGNYAKRNISLETYVMSKEVFKDLVKKARETSMFYTLSDIISESLDTLDVQGYPYKGYAACVNSFDSYYSTSMELKQRDMMKTLMSEKWPIYTRTNDSAPVKYGENATVKDSCISNGCVIKGTVINSVLGRNVVVGENAVLKNCIVMADTVIGNDIEMDYVIADKFVTVTKKNCIKGTAEEPVYICKYDKV